MFVITADQVGSRRGHDRVTDALRMLNRRELVLPAERTAGDELQLVTDDAATALDIMLNLVRDGQWSVGCGIGPVDQPLPGSTREATGPAFIAARAGVDRAKRRAGRAVIVGHASADEGSELGPRDLQAVLELLLTFRERRSDHGWELYDLLREGMTQAEAAARLGVTPQAASRRAQVAGLRVETAAVTALARLMALHDRETSGAASGVPAIDSDAGDRVAAVTPTDATRPVDPAAPTEE